ncbi:uncharacterized protein LOC126887667 [Diabrotica virgifera virgifera]|uniref:Uncharacterized protein LOC114340318 isoform X1 n=1 Tax=Diabrotica virgifera virgifera TaxID=50390 RepID=A0A6P7GNU7_DIAVI|nr:uncharacterized protein LOC126887667 [Diabrotica virgifera virgifera]
MKVFLVLAAFATLCAAKPTFLLDSLVIHKVAKGLGLGNVISVDGDARAKLGQNEIGVDLAGGIGGDVVGYHAKVDGNVLGQKVNVHGDIYDGDKVDAKNHQVYTDENGLQYILVRQYVGTNSLLVRKYLISGKMVIDGTNQPLDINARYPDTTVDVRYPNINVNVERPGYKIVQITYPDGTLRPMYVRIEEPNLPPGYIRVYDPTVPIGYRIVRIETPEVPVDPIRYTVIRTPNVQVNPIQIERVQPEYKTIRIL